MYTPMTNMKKGNTKSVGVIPSHPAHSRGVKMCAQLPGLLTNIMPTMMMSRRTSMARIHLLCDFYITFIAQHDFNDIDNIFLIAV